MGEVDYTMALVKTTLVNVLAYAVGIALLPVAVLARINRNADQDALRWCAQDLAREQAIEKSEELT